MPAAPPVATAIMNRKPEQPAPLEVADYAEKLLSQAVAAGASIDTLERLMALRKDMLAEKAKEAFNAAMAAFQAECPVIKKTKEVKTKAGKIAYKYAPIENAVTQVKELVERHGFRYTTTMKFNQNNQGEKTVIAFCRVVHKLGHEEVSEMEVPLGSKTDIMSQSQVVAAASTLAKRYAFLNAFGIMTGDEDNDTSTERPDVHGKPVYKDKIQEELNEMASKEQVQEIAMLCKELGKPVKELYAWYAKQKQYPPLHKGMPTIAAAKIILDALRKKTGRVDPATITEEENAAAEDAAQKAA